MTLHILRSRYISSRNNTPQHALASIALAVACAYSSVVQASSAPSTTVWNLQLGSSIAVKKTFHAYLDLPANAGVSQVVIHIDTASNISKTELAAPAKVNVYTLSGVEMKHQVETAKATQE